MTDDAPARRTVRRPRRPGPPVDDGFPEFEHNQWTFEGEIERLGGYAKGMHRAKQRRAWIRWVGYLVAVAFLLPLVIGALQIVL